MLNEGISEREFEALQNQVHLVKDMWEVHTMHHKDELRKEKDARHAEKKARKMMYKQSRMAHKMQFNDYK